MNLGRRLQRYPRMLERLYLMARTLVIWLAPLMKRLGIERVEPWIRRPEEAVKRWIFDCQMCGQCVLHSTGMTCPMTCPKNLRNGPCGGVRANGYCEVVPDIPCIWVQAFDRSQQLKTHANDLTILQPPLDRRLEGTSAWVNMITRIDQQQPPGWQAGESSKQGST
jgi:hypothetical protein